MVDASATRLDLLARVPLFARLAPERLAALARTATTRHLAAREELFHQGDRAEQVYVIGRGRLKVVSLSAGGDEVMLALLGAGEVVGELSMLIGGRRTAGVVALEASELVALGRREFLAFLREHPDAAIELMVVLGERLVQVNEFIEDTVFLGLPARLAKKLLVLAERFGEERGEATRIDLRLSQGELAEHVGTTRESVNKQMRAWSEQGVLRMERGEITLFQPDHLERLAGLVVD